MLTTAQWNSSPRILFVLILYMELGEGRVQASGLTHNNFNIVHFLASFSTKRRGKPASKQADWLVQSHLEYKWQCLQWKPTCLLFPLSCVRTSSWSGYGKTPEEWAEPWLPIGAMNTSYHMESHFLLLYLSLVRQNFNEVLWLEKQNGDLAKSMDKERMKKLSGRFSRILYYWAVMF